MRSLCSAPIQQQQTAYAVTCNPLPTMEKSYLKGDEKQFLLNSEVLEHIQSASTALQAPLRHVEKALEELKGLRRSSLIVISSFLLPIPLKRVGSHKLVSAPGSC